tara:strand:+ start:216 stop:965 length:750 start_codon:yes stop_codon:yes gene_type:complete
MCSAVAVGISMAIVSGAANASAAQSEAAYQNAVAEQRYQVAKRNAERNNQVAQQEYQNQLRIVAQQDEAKKRDYKAQLEAYEEALNANVKQTEINTISANLAASQVALKKKTANAKAAFDLEIAMAKMIKSQGELLSTGNAGQSFLLQTQEAERTLGFTTERIDEVLFNQNLGFGLELMDVGADYFSAETSAYNKLPGAPQSEQASMLPYVPILDPGPPKPIKRKANMGAAFLGGIASGIGAYGTAAKF